MKEITAIIKPFMLAKVQEALQCVGDFPGMTVSDCRGMSPARVDAAPKGGAPAREYVGKVKIQLLCADDIADHLVEIIAHAAHTGNPGDGLVYVVGVGSATRIRTFENM
jgi:nitrogen regulatory protein P-II 2